MASIEYFAGFFDGEGSIGVYRRGSVTLRLQIQVVGTHRESIEAWRNEFGGSIAFAPAKGTHRPSWHWVRADAPAHEVLAKLAPYLVVKRQEAELALQLRPGTRGHRIDQDERDRREYISKLLRQLKKAA